MASIATSPDDAIKQPFAAARMRGTVSEMAYAGAAAHGASAFNIVELVSVLYRDHLRYPGNDPRADGRDYLILTKATASWRNMPACVSLVG
jgi:transketolase N-terminal domain/subunit